MANKPRSGVDFFSRYVRLPDYERLIRSDCGVERMYAFVCLIDRIGDTGGYYTEWSDELCDLFAFDEGYSREDIEAVISSAIKRNFFNKEMYENYSILTSKHLQELYIMATQSRAYIVFDEKLLLIKLDEITGSRINKIKILNKDGYLICLSDYISNHKICINEDLSYINAEKNRIFPQSKGKEIKEKESKEKESKERNNSLSLSRARERQTAIKDAYGEFKNVMLSRDEYSRLKAEYDNAEAVIDELSDYMRSKGISYEDHYATLRIWCRDKKGRKNAYKTRQAFDEVFSADRNDDYMDFAQIHSKRRKAVGLA